MKDFFPLADPSVNALIVGDTQTTYNELTQAIAEYDLGGIPVGSVVALVGTFDLPTIAGLLALWHHGCVVVPMLERNLEREAIAEVEFVAYADGIEPTGRQAAHPLYSGEGPRLVLFTSGTSGKPKAVLHDVSRWMEKLARPGKRQRTLAFLSFDHVGGLNTLLYALFNGGTVVVPEDRSPSAVWKAIQNYEVELLPTTPTFLRLALLDGGIPSLPSLRLIAYGSEPMPSETLEAAKAALPTTDFLQQFGMSELGVLRSRSKEDGSTWVRLQGARVVDGLLEVQSDTAMLGYLNAPSPFTEDGWLKTGDEAEQDGEYFRVRGRYAETINVGGEKVHPAEVEAKLEALPGVLHAVVRGESNPITGNVVVAAVQLDGDKSIEAFRIRMRTELKGVLPRYAMPQRVERLEGGMTQRGKKLRKASPSGEGEGRMGVGSEEPSATTLHPQPLPLASERKGLRQAA